MKVLQPIKRKTFATSQPATRFGEKAIVSFKQDGIQLYGMVKSTANERCVVELLLPDSKGLLRKSGSDCLLEQDNLTTYADSAIAGEVRVKEWSASVEVSAFNADRKSLEEVKQNDVVVDYRNVTISGFLSTFATTTPKDREGDYVLPNAFKDTLAEFKQNPVILLDHRNSVQNLAGKFSKIGTNDKGLYVEGKISDSPDLRHARFLIAEGTLKTLSMGGFFYYAEDRHGIEQVRLFEGSLTPIPMNPDAQFVVRSVTPVTLAKCFASNVAI